MTGSIRHELSAVLLVTGLLATTQIAVQPRPVYAQATPQASPVEAGDQYTPVVASVFSTPRWFAGSDGQTHLVYELSLLNSFPVDVTLSELEVVDGRSGTELATYGGEELTAISSLLSVPETSTATLPPVRSRGPYRQIDFCC